MRKLFAAIVVISSVGFALPAAAGQCPKDMKKINAALAGGSSLSASQMSQVKGLLAEGGDLHKSGKHKASVDTLAKAKKILGIM